MKKGIRILSFSLVLGCFSYTWADAPSSGKTQDPYETFNRHSFALNQTVDKVVYTPVASMYKAVMPDVAEQGVSNFFANLGTIPTLANDILQLNGRETVRDTWRLFFNTTFGLFGLVDVASKIGLPRHENDFGTTLARYGYERSNYFVIPLLGPSTVRDTLGFGVDRMYLNVYPYIQDVRVRNQLLALEFIQYRAGLLQYKDLMDQAAIDPYVFQRNAFLQSRAHMITKNVPSYDSDDIDNSADDPYVAE